MRKGNSENTLMNIGWKRRFENRSGAKRCAISRTKRGEAAVFEHQVGGLSPRRWMGACPRAYAPGACPRAYAYWGLSPRLCRVNDIPIHWRSSGIAREYPSLSIEVFKDTQPIIKRECQTKRLVLFCKRRLFNDCSIHLSFPSTFLMLARDTPSFSVPGAPSRPAWVTT